MIELTNSKSTLKKSGKACSTESTTMRYGAQQKQAISAQLQEEMGNISKKWETTLNAFDEQAKQQLDELKMKQDSQKNKLIEECNNMTESIPIHMSSETLKLKKAEEELAKQGK
jgi:hypothetical protein